MICLAKPLFTWRNLALMKRLTLLCLLVGTALAQDASVLRGRVLDADTYQLVPNAQVGIGGNPLGTSTNCTGWRVRPEPLGVGR